MITVRFDRRKIDAGTTRISLGASPLILPRCWPTGARRNHQTNSKHDTYSAISAERRGAMLSRSGSYLWYVPFHTSRPVPPPLTHFLKSNRLGQRCVMAMNTCWSLTGYGVENVGKVSAKRSGQEAQNVPCIFFRFLRRGGEQEG